MNQRDKARIFRDLHSGPVLVLPNAWDVASARLVERAGAAAVATTSAGVSWSLGAADGGNLDRTSAIEAIARISDAVDVPVTADIEGGYSQHLDELAAVVRAVVAAGAVGVNFEDSASGGRCSASRTRALASRSSERRPDRTSLSMPVPMSTCSAPAPSTRPCTGRRPTWPPAPTASSCREPPTRPPLASSSTASPGRST